MLRPSAGFILISQPANDGLTMPIGTKMLREGVVVDIGASIFHASGKELLSPVDKGARVVFTYYEDEDITLEGKPYYLVPFTRIVGYHAA